MHLKSLFRWYHNEMSPKDFACLSNGKNYIKKGGPFLSSPFHIFVSALTQDFFDHLIYISVAVLLERLTRSRQNLCPGLLFRCGTLFDRWNTGQSPFHFLFYCREILWVLAVVELHSELHVSRSVSASCLHPYSDLVTEKGCFLSVRSCSWCQWG